MGKYPEAFLRFQKALASPYFNDIGRIEKMISFMEEGKEKKIEAFTEWDKRSEASSYRDHTVRIGRPSSNCRQLL